MHAVDDVSLQVYEGETLGLVGESGCGKSTLGRASSGCSSRRTATIRFEGRSIAHLARARVRPLRREMQMVFQDPYASLNPRKRVGSIIGDPLRIHRNGDGVSGVSACKSCSRPSASRRSTTTASRTSSPAASANGSGLLEHSRCEPKVVVADEPVSALDVSIQAQMLNLLEDLQEEFKLTYIFIAHDLGVVRHVSDRIAVMYLGKLVELSPAEELYKGRSCRTRKRCSRRCRSPIRIFEQRSGSS